jgi:hypothetical protein
VSAYTDSTAAEVDRRADSAPPAQVSAPIRWTFRTVITLHALAAIGQAVLAGRFLSGDYEMLRLHFLNSQAVGGLAIAQVVAGVVYWRRGGGPAWPALASFALLALEPFQIAAGIKRVIGIHVPLGVLIVSATVVFAVWAWRPTFGLRRSGARDRRVKSVQTKVDRVGRRSP